MFESFFSTPACGNYSAPGNMSPDVRYGTMSLGQRNTNFLGGVRMPAALNQDVYACERNERFKSKKGFFDIIAGIGTLVIGAVVLRKFGKLGKGFSSLFGSKK